MDPVDHQLEASDVMDWTRMPTTWGWWFFTAKPEDWDLASPVHVTRIDSRGDVRFERSFQDNKPSDQRERITPEEGWWFGPVHVRRLVQSGDGY